MRQSLASSRERERERERDKRFFRIEYKNWCREIDRESIVVVDDDDGGEGQILSKLIENYLESTVSKLEIERVI